MWYVYCKFLHYELPDQWNKYIARCTFKINRSYIPAQYWDVLKWKNEIMRCINQLSHAPIAPYLLKIKRKREDKLGKHCSKTSVYSKMTRQLNLLEILSTFREQLRLHHPPLKPLIKQPLTILFVHEKILVIWQSNYSVFINDPYNIYILFQSNCQCH